MPRPRKPTAVLQLTGAFRKDPQRAAARADEPMPEGDAGPAPAYFDEHQRAAYAELIRMAHTGVLCSSDSVAVEIGAVLLARLRTNPNGFKPGEFSRLQAILAALGMTPADRSRVSALKPKPAVPAAWLEFTRPASER